MTTLWPWLAVAGAGALHGLNPCTGWPLLVARRGAPGRAGGAPSRPLATLALGHAASVAAVALLVARGMAATALPWLAGTTLLTAATLLFWRRTRRGRTSLALWSFGIATAHGSGLMLVPALVPLCLSASPAREITASGSLVLTLAAVGVHMGAMLAVMAVATWLACRANRFGKWRHPSAA